MSETTITATTLVALPTSLGTFEAALTQRGVCCLTFPNQPGARDELDAYLRGELTELTAPVDLIGTPFQVAVWRQLQAIPYGEVRSYADVARAVGRPAAVRAVGAANGANPVPVIVPCHRVIGSAGALTGFGAGIEWKRRLLATENPARWAELPLSS